MRKLKRPSESILLHPLSVLALVAMLCASGPARADGLIFQLPEDGVEAEFRGEVEFQTKFLASREIVNQLSAEDKARLERKGKSTEIVTVASVGRVNRANQVCRWIELRKGNGQGEGQILKMLIPEQYLKQGEDPLDHAILTFFNPKPIDKRGGPKETGFNRIQYEIDRFRPEFPRPFGEIRRLPKRTIVTNLAVFEDCRILAGKTRFDRPLLGQGRWTNESRWEIAMHPEAPFGVVQVRCCSETDEIGGEPISTTHIIARYTLTLNRVGRTAKSLLPEVGGSHGSPVK